MVENKTMGIAALILLAGSLIFAGGMGLNEFLEEEPQFAYFCEATNTVKPQCLSLSDSGKTCYTYENKTEGTRCLVEPYWKKVDYELKIEPETVVETVIKEVEVPMFTIEVSQPELGDIKIKKAVELENSWMITYAFNFELEAGRNIVEDVEMSFDKPLPDEADFNEAVKEHAKKTFNDKYNKPVEQKVVHLDHEFIGKIIN